MFESPKRHQFSLNKSSTLQIQNAFARTSDSAGEAGGRKRKRVINKSTIMNFHLHSSVTGEVDSRLLNDMMVAEAKQGGN